MRRVEGVSTLIDGCDRLLRQKAATAYMRVNFSHRGWISQEDLLQEALLTAFLTEQKKFRKRRKTKFSTYLYRGLDWHLRRVVDALQYEKRDAQVVSLDAPINTADSGTVNLVDALPAEKQVYAYGPGLVRGNRQRALDPESIGAVRAFVELCRHVSDDAVAVLIRGFLFSDIRQATPEVCDEIAAAAAKLRVGISDLRLVSSDTIVQKLILTLIGQYVMIKVGTEEALRVLRCQGCNGQFPISAIRHGRFFVGPMTCRTCLERLQALPANQSCFGKEKTAYYEGYSPSDPECRLHCADRVACKTFVKEIRMVNEAEAAVAGVDLSEVEEETAKVNTKKKAAAKKAPAKKAVAKKAAAKKEPKAKKDKGPSRAAVKEAELVKKEKEEGWAYPYAEVPKNVVEWPYRRTSQMLYVFMAMLKGINKNKIKNDIILYKSGAKEGTKLSELTPKQRAQGEASWKSVYKIMATYEHSSHNWKLSEEGDQYKITEVKFTGKQEKPKKGKAAA